MTETALRPSEVIHVADGRAVAYEAWGPASGRPTLYFHGFPSSRVEAGLHEEQASRCGIRLVAADRPGYGGSQRAKLSIPDVAADALAVADSIGAPRFDVVGVSGGTPYALACAALAPDRVRAVALMAPLGPPDAPRYGMRPANRVLLALASRYSPVFAVFQRVAANVVRKRPEEVVALLSKTLPEREQALVADDTLRAAFARVLFESTAQRGAGGIADGMRLTRPWPIDLTNIVPPVHIWHGLVDDIVPPGMGGALQARLPAGTALTLAPLDGHFSLLRNHIEDAFAWLAEAGRDA